MEVPVDRERARFEPGDELAHLRLDRRVDRRQPRRVRAVELELHPFRTHLFERFRVDEADVVALERVLDRDFPVRVDHEFVHVDLRTHGSADSLERIRGVAEPRAKVRALAVATAEDERAAPRDVVWPERERCKHGRREVVELRTARDAVRHAVLVVDPAVVRTAQRAVALAARVDPREPVRTDIRECPELARKILHHDGPSANHRGDEVVRLGEIAIKGDELPRVAKSASSSAANTSASK